MQMFTTRRWVAGAVLGASAVAVYVRRVEPWLRRWGATNPERSWHVPIDDLVERGGAVTTRAVTVHAPIEHVWPWLVQIGQDRAGFYSYTKLENLVAAGMRNADVVNPAWQRREVGDSVWLADPQRWYDRGRQIVALVDPPRSLVLVSPADWARLCAGGLASGAWGFHLHAETERRTRFLVRTSGGAVGMHTFDLLHFVMEQKMMRGLRARAEAAEPRATSTR
jgi:hypothetical protein